MGIIKLTVEQVDFLKNEFPYLKYDVGKNAINGILSFNLKFGNEGEIIIDEYQIEIELNHVSDLGMPIVRETAKRIIEIAKNKNIPPDDLHLNNQNGEMCIIIPPKTKERYPNGFDLKILLEHIQEHLYWISYFEKHNKAPWKEYGHGELGYFELYLEDKEKYSNEFKKYFNCNSRQKFRRKIKELKNKYKI
jgi:hypothetical protein